MYFNSKIAAGHISGCELWSSYELLLFQCSLIHSINNSTMFDTSVLLYSDLVHLKDMMGNHNKQNVHEREHTNGIRKFEWHFGAKLEFIKINYE